MKILHYYIMKTTGRISCVILASTPRCQLNCSYVERELARSNLHYNIAKLRTYLSMGSTYPTQLGGTNSLLQVSSGEDVVVDTLVALSSTAFITWLTSGQCLGTVRYMIALITTTTEPRASPSTCKNTPCMFN